MPQAFNTSRDNTFPGLGTSDMPPAYCNFFFCPSYRRQFHPSVNSNRPPRPQGSTSQWPQKLSRYSASDCLKVCRRSLLKNVSGVASLPKSWFRQRNPSPISRIQQSQKMSNLSLLPVGTAFSCTPQRLGKPSKRSRASASTTWRIPETYAMTVVY
jgi:hypothetical protein